MALRVRGRVVGGHLRVDIPVELAENTEVELIEAPAAEEEELDPELEAALGEAAAEIARGEGSFWEEVPASKGSSSSLQ
ncbi:MAG TPA: hypothetical protein VEU29_07265 [Actinomycetota bacterium]|nr:hypothetical protein [Actinomycetota bacterium]